MRKVYMILMLLLTMSVASAQQKELFVLHTSDTHSRIEPLEPTSADRYRGMGGVARRSAYIKQMRELHPNLLLLDCGDISQGTPYYNMFQGELEIKCMNLMGYDAMTIGNHEFDFGMEINSIPSIPYCLALYSIARGLLHTKVALCSFARSNS